MGRGERQGGARPIACRAPVPPPSPSAAPLSLPQREAAAAPQSRRRGRATEQPQCGWRRTEAPPLAFRPAQSSAAPAPRGKARSCTAAARVVRPGWPCGEPRRPATLQWSPALKGDGTCEEARPARRAPESISWHAEMLHAPSTPESFFWGSRLTRARADWPAPITTSGWVEVRSSTGPADTSTAASAARSAAVMMPH